MLELKHCIDPTVDYVFKKLLASKGREALLLDFVNSLLSPKVPLSQLTLLNPFNEKDFNEDKLSVVDIKAQDENGSLYQIEIQIGAPAFLPKRILHNWSALYHKQIQSGEHFDDLAPVISIWLLTTPLFKEIDSYHLHFQPWDVEYKLQLSKQMSIHLFQLSKWHKPATLQPMDNWLYLLRDGGLFHALPNELQSNPNMVEAMTVLKEISETEEDYYRYQARQEYLRVKKSEEHEREQNLKAIEALGQQKEALKQEASELKQEASELKQETSELKQKLAASEQQILEEKRQTVKAMLQNGLSKTQVLQISGLNEQQLNDLL